MSLEEFKTNLKRNDGAFYIVVLDFEATCDEIKPCSHEVIEFLSIMFEWIPNQNPVHWKEISRFESFVRPSQKPIISKFCNQLTSITQDDIDKAPPFDQVWKDHYQWMLKHIGGEKNLSRTLILTCGAWDLQTMLSIEANIWNVYHFPEVYKRFCNIKKSFERWFGEGRGGLGGLAGLMRHFKFKFEGHHHRGIDDCWNTSRVCHQMLKDGFTFVPEDVRSTGFGMPKKYRIPSRTYNLFDVKPF